MSLETLVMWGLGALWGLNVLILVAVVRRVFSSLDGIRRELSALHRDVSGRLNAHGERLARLEAHAERRHAPAPEPGAG